MAFSKKFALSMIAALSLVTCGVMGCDSDDETGTDQGDSGQSSEDSGSKKSSQCNEGKQGFDAACKCLQTTTDWTKTGKKDIATYLASICKLSTSFTEDKFQNTPTEEQGLGANCFCYGKKCNYAGYERPELQKTNNDAIIYGCDNVAEEYNGAVRSCFRSTYIPEIKPAIYFPFGACALTMSECIPSEECDPDYDGPDCTADQAKQKNDQTICGFAKFGTYDTSKFTDCPTGGVLVDFVMNIAITNLGRKAKLNVRGCMQGCHTDDDCNGVGSFDPITQEQAQYKCTETDAAVEGEFVGKKAKVCFDRRSIKDSDKGLVLVNPGDFAIE